MSVYNYFLGLLLFIASISSSTALAVKSDLDPTIAQAYQLYQQGNIDAAWQTYLELNQQIPNEPNILLALAMLALHKQDTANSSLYFKQLLNIEPNNPFAQAYLIQHHSPLAEQESQLLTQLQKHSAAPLYFALGNIYARQQRWHDARQAYHYAQYLQPNHPAYLFNLAISLEHMGKLEDAQKYYQQARNSQYASLIKIPLNDE